MDDNTQDLFEGTWHALCAIVAALEQRDPGAKQAIVGALTAKAAWLAAHNTPITKAAATLELRDWIISPPPNPADPYGGPPPDRPPQPERPAPYQDARILPFPRPRRPPADD